MCAKDDSRQKILNAAFEAFMEKGYSNTSMDDIVKRSGLSKGTLYWHFKNKQELFIAIIRFAFQPFDDLLANLVEQDQPAATRIQELFLQAVAFISDKRFMSLVVDAFFQSSQNAEAQQVLYDIYKQYIEHVEQIIQQGIDNGEFRDVDPHTIAVALMAGGDGIAFYSLFEPEWNLPNAIHVLVDLILRGIRKEPSDA